MLIGTLEVRLILRQARTLKDKRQVVSSIKDKLHDRFNISVAEIEAQEMPQTAVLGIAMVSNEADHLRKALGEIVNALRSHPVAELASYEIDV